MPTVSLPVVCSIAFVTVFILLAFLAGVMRLIMRLFPVRVASTDVALVAAISSAVSLLYPGGMVTSIEEER